MTRRPIQLDDFAVTDLESLPGITWGDKADILLTAAGLRPSALAHLEHEGSPIKPGVLGVEGAQIEAFGAVLDQLGLQYVTRNRVLYEDDEKQLGKEIVDFFASRDGSSANKLKDAFIAGDHTLIGLTLGYPKTAVEAFLTADMLPPAGHPTSTATVSEQNMRLLAHRLSKSHWKDEVHYLQEGGEALKKISPLIYARITVR